MRFQVGDVLKQPGNINWRWRVVNIQNDRYKIEYKTNRNADWTALGMFTEGQVADLELDDPAPVREELIIYTLIYVNNAGIKSTYSSPDEESVMQYKRATERLGYSVVAMKKFKTRI